MLVLSTRIVLDCFYLPIFYSEKFSTDVCRLPYAANVNLNLSIFSLSPVTVPEVFVNVYSAPISPRFLSGVIMQGESGNKLYNTAQNNSKLDYKIQDFLLLHCLLTCLFFTLGFVKGKVLNQ